MAKPSILIISFSPISSSPRVRKQVAILRDEYEVVTAGFGAEGISGTEHIELATDPELRGIYRLRGLYQIIFLLRMFRAFTMNNPRFLDAIDKLSFRKWDVIIAHNSETVPIARTLRPNMGVMCDLHEYAPEQHEPSAKWRFLVLPYIKWLLRHEVRHVDEVINVGEGIIDRYEKEFGIRSALVTNASPYKEFEPTPTASPIRLVHSGIPAPERRPEVMIEAVKQSRADVTLDFYFMETDREYLAKLKELAGSDARIAFQKPVAYEQLVETLHSYDLGLSFILPTQFNDEWCLPNKFFDFIQARLGIIIGPSPELAQYVGKYGLGAVAEDFSAASLAIVLDGLTLEQVDAWKRAAHDCAYELSAEQQSGAWLEGVERIVAAASARA
ncbi:MAG: glycosyltransferase family 1 protein [Candidatus Leucobacter sulfamidivorax]|nr:glycosyltransferase family 1 protein [Candidatus Leucobacter sulfamidivorax]